jgi:NAD(P)-dependent dehydrogenase (short-subunit alcohol dehydrogenase family)
VKPLHDCVALVTGASRGGGKGIALVLGERGATVYVTGRSVRGEPTTLGRPGTIERGCLTGRKRRRQLSSRIEVWVTDVLWIEKVDNVDEGRTPFSHRPSASA